MLPTLVQTNLSIDKYSLRSVQLSKSLAPFPDDDSEGIHDYDHCCEDPEHGNHAIQFKPRDHAKADAKRQDILETVEDLCSGQKVV